MTPQSREGIALQQSSEEYLQLKRRRRELASVRAVARRSATDPLPDHDPNLRHCAQRNSGGVRHSDETKIVCKNNKTLCWLMTWFENKQGRFFDSQLNLINRSNRSSKQRAQVNQTTQQHARSE